MAERPLQAGGTRYVRELERRKGGEDCEAVRNKAESERQGVHRIWKGEEREGREKDADRWPHWKKGKATNKAHIEESVPTSENYDPDDYDEKASDGSGLV